jgi:hypothetical protein
MPLRFEAGQKLPPRDDIWIVISVSDKGVLHIENPRTSHAPDLGADQVHSFMTDPGGEHDGLKHGFLLLHVQFTYRDRTLSIDPLPPGSRDGAAFRSN